MNVKFPKGPKLGPMLTLLLAAMACTASRKDAGDDEAVSATAQAVAIADYTLPLTSVDGTYSGACTGHAGGEAWSLPLVPGATLGNPQLSVKKNNGACVLSITAVRDSVPSTWTMTPAINLTTSFQATAQKFTEPGGLLFYANFKADSLAYSGPFNILFEYSDKDNDVPTNKGGTHNSVTASVTSSNVPAPLYTLDLSTLEVDDDVVDGADAAGTTIHVTGTLGSSTATPAGQAAQRYMVYNFPLPATWGGIDATFGGIGGGTAFAGNLVLNGSQWSLPAGTVLPTTRVLILQNVQDGIPSYQTFTVTFNP